tara:strand:+ start:647 stop:1342 length:696 start_codon:yes stop_codon:yes gene_type:complete
MPNASTIAGNKIWGGYHAEPVLIRRGSGFARKVRALAGSILCQQPGQLGAAGGVSASPAKLAEFCGFGAVSMALVAAACRSTGAGSAQNRAFGHDVPLMNNQRRPLRRSINRPASSAAPRLLTARRGASPLSDRAPAPHAGRARVTSDFRVNGRADLPHGACTTGLTGSGGAEHWTLTLGSGVRGHYSARNLARKARKTAVYSGNPSAMCGEVLQAYSNPVPVIEAAPERG